MSLFAPPEGSATVAPTTRHCHANKGKVMAEEWVELWRTEEPGNLLVTFTACCRNNIIIALSGQCGLDECMFKVVGGGRGDLVSTLWRLAPNGRHIAKEGGGGWEGGGAVADYYT